MATASSNLIIRDELARPVDDVESTRFVVPDEVLELANEWQAQHSQLLTLAMPTEERAWRDNQHYRAYARKAPEYLYDICPEELK